MGFGSVFTTSFKEYTSNFKFILKMIFLFVGIPSLAMLLLTFLFVVTSESYRSAVLGTIIETAPMPLFALITIILFSIISILLIAFVQAGFIGISLKKSKFNFKDFMKMGKEYFFKFIGFSIVYVLFIYLLLLLLIVPGIIFIVYWTFGIYIFYEKKLGIRKSLKVSRYMIRGKWWRVVGYALLVFLIIYAAIGIFSGIILGPFTIYFGMLSLSGSSIPIWAYLTYAAIETIVNFVVSLITLPFFILFFKNFYLEMKKETKFIVKNK